MTPYQELEKAKRESLKKWEKIAFNDPDTHIGDDCGFCDAYQSCKDYDTGKILCPMIMQDEDQCSTMCAGASTKANEDKTSYALAVMVYIHGFTVADLPEETK